MGGCQADEGPIAKRLAGMKDCLQAEMVACSHIRMLESFFVDAIIN